MVSNFPNPLENLGALLPENLGYVILFVVLGLVGLYFWMWIKSTCPLCRKPWMKKPKDRIKLNEEIVFKTEQQDTGRVDGDGRSISVSVRVPYRHIDERFIWNCKGCNHTWSEDKKRVEKG